MKTVFSVTSFRDVHDIFVTTEKGREFIINIYLKGQGYESEVTILDTVPATRGSWVYETKPKSPSAESNFRAGIELIEQYLIHAKTDDTIKDIHNPCNCPFISESNQNNELSQLGYNGFSVRVN
ncbi:MAG: hypothetical protein MK088_15290 [Alteromonas sp.]|nr:hypothetical protein [Alteromonas sp.]